MSTLSILIESGVLTLTDTGSYRCKCGSNVKNTSIHSHLKSKKHKKYEESQVIETECTICYTHKTQFYTCHSCRNNHCMDCHTHIQKCPFCRSVFELPHVKHFQDKLNDLYHLYRQTRTRIHLAILYDYILSNTDLFKHVLKELREEIVKELIGVFVQDIHTYNNQLYMLYEIIH